MSIAARFRELANRQHLQMTMHPFRMAVNSSGHHAYLECKAELVPMQAVAPIVIDSITASDFNRSRGLEGVIRLSALLDKTAWKLQCDWLAYFESNLWC